jgi:hypothetical protein
MGWFKNLFVIPTDDVTGSPDPLSGSGELKVADSRVWESALDRPQPLTFMDELDKALYLDAHHRRLLTGVFVELERIGRMVDDGLPVNPDGTVDLSGVVSDIQAVSDRVNELRTEFGGDVDFLRGSVDSLWNVVGNLPAGPAGPPGPQGPPGPSLDLGVWVPITLAPGFEPVDGNDPFCRMIPGNNLQIVGEIARSNGSNFPVDTYTSVCSAMASAFRPYVPRSYVIATYGGQGAAHASAIVNTSGVIQVSPKMTSPAKVVLDGTVYVGAKPARES